MLSQLAQIAAPAVVGALGGMWLQRARERHHDSVRAAERALQARGSIRLVEHELFCAEQAIDEAARAGVFWSASRPLTTGAWERQRLVVGAELGRADWHRVHAAYDAIVDLNATLPLLAAQGRATATISTSEDPKLELRWWAIRLAAWILRAQVGDAEPVEKALDEDERLAEELFGRSAETSPTPDRTAGVR